MGVKFVSARAPYKPRDFAEKIVKAYEEGKPIKNTNLTDDELHKLTKKPLNTCELYVKREDYREALSSVLYKEWGWNVQQAVKEEKKPAVKIVGCTPGPLGIVRYPIFPKWCQWIQEGRPRPLQQLTQFIEDRPRIMNPLSGKPLLTKTVES